MSIERDQKVTKRDQVPQTRKRELDVETQRAKRIQSETRMKTCSDMQRRNKSRGSTIWNQRIAEISDSKTGRGHWNYDELAKVRVRNNVEASKRDSNSS